MKKLIFVLLALCLTATACINKEPDVEEKYPKDISFTKYILDATSCQWKNFEYNNSKPDNGKVLIINSNEELKNYIECTNGSYPEIDFSKNTLLLIRSISKQGIHHIDIDFIKDAANEYTLNAAVYMLMTMNAPQWTRGIIVPKMDNKTKITFNENYTNYTENDTNMNFLIGTWHNYLDNSQYTFLNNDTLYIDYPSESWKWTYYFISKDSIQIERLTEPEANPYTRKTNNKIIFYNSDSILIENFHVSDAAVFPPTFVDIKLFKTK